jgi:hypothetical protein
VVIFAHLEKTDTTKSDVFLNIGRGQEVGIETATGRNFRGLVAAHQADLPGRNAQQASESSRSIHFVLRRFILTSDNLQASNLTFNLV